MAHQTETEYLDYKRAVNLTDPRAKIELAKDVAAMGPTGGYLLIGVNGDGTVSGEMSYTDAADWDESRITPMLARWLPKPIDILVAVHEFPTGAVVVLYVHPHPQGFYVMVSDGQYTDATGQPKSAFSTGAVYVRHGTRNEPVQPTDMARIVERLVGERKEDWRRDVVDSLAPTLAAAAQGQSISRAPAAALEWQLPVDVFAQAVVELTRSGDLVPVRLLLRTAARFTQTSLLDEDPDLGHEAILDRIAIIAAVGVVLRDRELFDLSLVTLSAVYRCGLDPSGNKRHDIHVPPTLFWLHALARVFALGGLLVRQQEWAWLPALVLQGPLPGEMEYYGNWLRHGITEAARANMTTRLDENGRMQQIALPSLARDVADGLPFLGDDEVPGSEGILDSICQFDALAALVAMNAGGQADTRYFYTNCAAFRPYRTLPILERLIADQVMRTSLGLEEDIPLAMAIQKFVSMAESESARLGSWWMRGGGQVDIWVNNVLDQV
jgi:hypothetical protein